MFKFFIIPTVLLCLMCSSQASEIIREEADQTEEHPHLFFEVVHDESLDDLVDKGNCASFEFHECTEDAILTYKIIEAPQVTVVRLIRTQRL